MSDSRNKSLAPGITAKTGLLRGLGKSLAGWFRKPAPSSKADVKGGVSLSQDQISRGRSEDARPAAAESTGISNTGRPKEPIAEESKPSAALPVAPGIQAAALSPSAMPVLSGQPDADTPRTGTFLAPAKDSLSSSAAQTMFADEQTSPQTTETTLEQFGRMAESQGQALQNSIGKARAALEQNSRATLSLVDRTLGAMEDQNQRLADMDRRIVKLNEQVQSLKLP